MDDGDGLGGMRMGIGFIRPAKGRPSRMGNPGAPLQVLLGEARLQVLQFALGATSRQAPVLEGRHTRRVIAPVLEALERVDQLSGDGLMAQNPDNPAHRHPPRWNRAYRASADP